MRCFKLKTKKPGQGAWALRNHAWLRPISRINSPHVDIGIQEVGK